MKTVTASHFATGRHTPTSAHAHFDGTWDSLLGIVTRAMESGEAKPGYRPGVLLVPVPPQGFFSSLKRLDESDAICGEFRARPNSHPEEAPVVHLYARGNKVPAAYVEVVLYSKDVLLEGHPPEDLTGGDYEVVTILAGPTHGTTPMDPMTFVRNYRGLPGGTEMKGLSVEDAFHQLCDSVLFWSQHIHVKP